MRYIDVAWNSGDASDPYRLISELDEQGFETWKLEFFRSGAVGSASRHHETRNTALGTASVPGLEKINGEPELLGRESSPDDFARLWWQGACPREALRAVGDRDA